MKFSARWVMPPPADPLAHGSPAIPAKVVLRFTGGDSGTYKTWFAIEHEANKVTREDVEPEVRLVVLSLNASDVAAPGRGVLSHGAIDARGVRWRQLHEVPDRSGIPGN
jgi:hypothetical protein